MAQLLCRNHVKDFAHWKTVFDTHTSAHGSAGLELLHLWQDVNDPNQAWFIFQVKNIPQAIAFMNTPESAKAGAAAGVIDGEYHFLVENLLAPL
jgi:hypothetical protein